MSIKRFVQVEATTGQHGLNKSFHTEIYPVASVFFRALNIACTTTARPEPEDSCRLKLDVARKLLWIVIDLWRHWPCVSTQRGWSCALTSRTMKKPDDTDHKPSTWGPWLLGAVLVGMLVFFWWLVIYDHGVAPH